MPQHFRISEETRKRCAIIPADERTLRQFKSVSPEYFSYLLEAPESVTFSLYFHVENELIEFIKPNELSRELLTSLVKAHDRALDDSKICLRKKDLPAFLAFMNRIRNSKITQLKHSLPGLNPQVLAVYETLSGASQLVVKGGIDKDAASQIEEAAAALISNQLGAEQSVDTLSQLVLCDPTLYDHSASVAMFAGLIAGQLRKKEGLKLPFVNSTQVALSGLYHDVGKTCVPNQILNKPGKLTDEEFEVMKTHTTLGYQELLSAQLSGVDIDNAVARVALEHHERFSGGGYPMGKKGRLEDSKEEGIHIYSRIVSIADVYSALLMKRIYKEAYDPKQAIDIMRKIATKDFDPDVFAVFEEVVSEVVQKSEDPDHHDHNHSGRIIRVG